MTDPDTPKPSRLLKVAWYGVVWPIGVLAFLWSVAAIYFLDYVPYWVRIVLAIDFAVVIPLALRYVKDRRRAVRLAAAVILIVVVAHLQVTPRNDRQWSRDQAVLANVSVDGERISFENLRRITYVDTDDYEVDYYDQSFDLDDLESVWFGVEQFSVLRGPAHTLLSFGFSGDRYVAVSVEIRKETGEDFSALQGAFKRYEIMYVMGDERDLLGLRSTVRNDPTYLYPIKATHNELRTLLLDIIDRANHLRGEPEFYGTLKNNCTTNIVHHVNRIAPGMISGYNWKVMFPGYSDRLVYDLGLIDTETSFEETRRKCRINQRAAKYANHPEFSRLIRLSE